MPRLAEPGVAVHESFLVAMAEFEREGRGGASDYSMLGSEIRSAGSGWADPAVFARFAEGLRADALEHTARPAGYVPASTRWWVEGGAYLGRIVVRHRLTDHLLRVGGHIGYDVLPTARRLGHASAMLAAVLPLCRELGIADALITCDAANVGSRRVIEANGGRFDDERDEKLRYWVSTAATP